PAPVRRRRDHRRLARAGERPEAERPGIARAGGDVRPLAGPARGDRGVGPPVRALARGADPRGWWQPAPGRRPVVRPSRLPHRSRGHGRGGRCLHRRPRRRAAGGPTPRCDQSTGERGGRVRLLAAGGGARPAPPAEGGPKPRHGGSPVISHEAGQGASLAAAPPGSLTPTLIGSALVAALGGLLFGFDTAVISGTTDALTTAFRLNSFSLGFTV